MSAKALISCSFAPAAKQTVAIDHQTPEGIAAEIAFRDDLWREYQREAIHAGCNTAQATEYAGALIPEMGLVVAVGRTPWRRAWFYQSEARVVRRTFASGLIPLGRWEKSKTTGRTATAGALIFAFDFRPWNPGRNN